MAFRDDGFFYALKQQPDDDALRLIYAGSLQECGQAASAAHAELIRVQVALGSAWPGSVHADELAVRQNDLIADWELESLTHVPCSNWQVCPNDRQPADRSCRRHADRVSPARG